MNPALADYFGPYIFYDSDAECVCDNYKDALYQNTHCSDVKLRVINHDGTSTVWIY